MWGIFAGITVFIILLRLIEEWRLHREDKSRLTGTIRKHPKAQCALLK